MELTTIIKEKIKATATGKPAFVTQKSQPLTSSEIANVWLSYMNYSMLRCVARASLNHVEDADVLPLLEESLSICNTSLEIISEFLRDEGHPQPKGFDDSDLNLNAPRLFSDIFNLYYLKHLMKSGISIIATNMTMSTRSDLRKFYTDCLINTAEFWNKIADVLLEKGLFVRLPNVTVVKKVDFIKKQNFMGGFFGDQRPLLAKEVEQIAYNVLSNTLGKYLLSGYRQVAESKKVRSYIERGMKISTQHADKFSDILKKEGIPAPQAWDYEVTDSTIPPYSDKFMMHHTILLIAAGFVNYASSLASSARRDLVLVYTQCMAETASYSDDGANIMIENGWMEEPPRLVDRDELINKLH